MSTKIVSQAGRGNESLVRLSGKAEPETVVAPAREPVTSFLRPVVTLLTMFILATQLCAETLIENEQGVKGYSDTPRLPWCNYRKHDASRPLPPYVDPGPVVTSSEPPSDAIVLFDGQDLHQWEENEWRVVDGQLQAGAGELRTKQSFGDCQLHLEFQIPAGHTGHLFDRGNSGVYLMCQYEIQIFDSHPSHAKQIYPDGQCAAIYGDTPPLVNACREAARWQSFDIVFTAPVFENQNLLKPAAITLFHNNVLVHSHAVIHAPTSHLEIFRYQPHPVEMPLFIQGHNSPVRFRNIWIRPLTKSTTDQGSSVQESQQ